MNKRRDEVMDTITEDTPLSEAGSFAGENQNYLTTFRVAGNTTINQFKEMACKFWVINILLKSPISTSQE